MKSPAQPHKDYVIVDVRDDDYIGGNIKGSLNYPSYAFEECVDELVEKTKDVKTVVFHCALSQQRSVFLVLWHISVNSIEFLICEDRGPKAARVSWSPSLSRGRV